MKFSELKKKEVISVKECRKLGHVCDFEFDPCKGQIECIMVPSCARICSWWNDEPEIVIPYHCIRQFGTDIILVDI